MLVYATISTPFCERLLKLLLRVQPVVPIFRGRVAAGMHAVSIRVRARVRGHESDEDAMHAETGL